MQNTTSQNFVPLAAAKPQIADGDLLLFRRRGLIATAELTFTAAGSTTATVAANPLSEPPL